MKALRIILLAAFVCFVFLGAAADLEHNDAATLSTPPASLEGP